MGALQTVALFILTALAEIVGCYLPYLWLRKGHSIWLLRDNIDGRDGWTIVDCGISRDEVKALWEDVFKNELEGLPVLRVIVTHMHPDHIGLAHWLCERWDARLWMTMTDFMVASLWSSRRTEAGGGPGGQSAVEHFARHGLTDPDAQEQIRQRANYFPNLVPAVPARYTRIMHGDQIRIGERDWRVIVGYGHAPEHASLHSPGLNVLISGDMVLPRISTNVSVYDNDPESDALGLFLESIDKFKPLPADTLVLPSHGKPFKGLHTRIEQLHAHHRDRLAEVLAACRRQPQSAADVLKVLFSRALDAHQVTFAMGESIAHLNWLMHRGQVRRQRDAEGVHRFSA